MRAIFTGILLTAAVHAGPAGFASMPVDGRDGTTGGGETSPVIVRTAGELRSALERLDLADRSLRDRSPRVIRLAGDIDLAELANGNPGTTLKRVGIVRPRSHTTLEGPPGGATLRHGTVEIKGVENVILRNLRFRELWENDPGGAYDSLGWDFVRVTSAGKNRSRHVWIDHCDFGRVYDGQVDIVHGSDLVTISNSIFAGEGPEPQKKCMLIGHSSSDSARAADKGRLNVTIHGCWFRNLESRCPRLRTGNVHFYHNLVENVGTGTVSVAGGATLAEHCVYRGCRLAGAFSFAGDSTEKGLGGSIRFIGSGTEKPVENHPTDFRFNAPAGFDWQDLSRPPYEYRLLPTAGIESLVRKGSGPR